jgi:hypothetical protein
LFDERARAKVDSFVQWLSSGTGVYHIAGKLGSGKSTLMKYLSGHDRVREELQKWAGEFCLFIRERPPRNLLAANPRPGDTKLVVASFFFWRKGSPLQRSLPGLFRSLLHDVLEQQPDLIPEVLPDLWHKVLASPAWAFTDPLKAFDYDSDRVKTAFSRLLQCTSLHQSTKFCFFIDGLDEYEETTQDDYKAMVQLLVSWTQAAPQSVKLCVSSREYNVFLNFFSDTQRLRLQYLTLADMKHYVREKLKELAEEDLDRFVDTITTKANGIFLWVALVVKSIRARLEDGCGVSVIEEEVNALPEELEGLFQHLLNSISKPYLRGAYRTFAVVQLQEESYMQPCLGLLGYSFLDDYALDPEFAQKPHPAFAQPTETTSEARSQREEAARKRLNAHCKGLLELNQNSQLAYTHRSVVEFLGDHLQHAPKAKSLLADFDPVQALCQLLLAELRSRPHDTSWIQPRNLRGHTYLKHHYTPIDIHLRLIFRLRADKKLDWPPYSYFEALRSAAESAIPEHDRPDLPLHERFPGVLPSGTWWNPASVINHAAASGMYDYLDQVTRADPSTLDSNDKIANLAWSTIRAGIRYSDWWLQHGPHVPFGGVSVLLRRGISPNAVIHTNSWSEQVGIPLGATFWEQMVLSLVTNTHIQGPLPTAGRIIQEFLEHGASPDIRIALETRRVRDDTTSPRDTSASAQPGRQFRRGPLWLQWRVELEKHQANGQTSSLLSTHRESGIDQLLPKITFRKGAANEKIITCDHLFGENHPEIIDRDAVTRYHSFVASRGGEISFEDFVEFHNFDNKEAILALCSRSRKERTGDVTSSDADGKHITEVEQFEDKAESKNTASDRTPSDSPTRGNEQARDTLDKVEETGRLVVNGVLGTGAGRPTRVWRATRSRVVDIIISKQCRPSLLENLYIRNSTNLRLLALLAALMLSQMVVRIAY